MWLDRFSGHSTPSASPVPWNRSQSPIPPRRSSHLAPNALPRRPALNQRVSSWSGLTNGSSESLPSSARLPSGSNLRIQLNSNPQEQATNSLDVLKDILASAQSGEKHKQHGKDDTLCDGPEVDIDFDGLSLQGYALRDVDVAGQAVQSEQYSEASFRDHESEKDKFEDLHKSIAACDDVLRSVEKYLTSFQADLANVSAEIETLQDRSAVLNTKLQSRKDVEKILGPEVDALSLSPASVQKISEGSLDESWTEALAVLENRSKAVESTNKNRVGVKAVEDLRPLMMDLKDKAVERIRDYIVGQIKALRSPGVNAQLVQRSSLLKFKNAYSFLSKHQPQLEQEIGKAYINTMRWYYLSNFTRYKTALDKLNLHIIDKNDALTHDDAAKRVASSASRHSAQPHDAFVLGRRIDVSRSPTPIALPSSVAEESKASHYLEIPFRAFNLALVDNASAEYSFLTDFFSTQSFQTVNRRFNEIFEPTFALGQGLTKQLVDPTLDALGILMCVRLNQHSAFELQRRKVPSMDGYINGTSMLLWPRFQMVMDTHCESIRKATTALPGRPAGSALSLTASSSSNISIAPHPITQKFANFAHGILVLSTDAGDDEPVHRSLGRLRTDFEAFLVKLSKGIGESKKRERFLANNYSLVVTIVQDTEGKMAEELKSRFAELRDNLGERR